ncbi:cytochrome P450 [Mycena galopus ATCC 62051]|nr:cytochrome P450 [Mycena galopus ATCC 62051]
MGNFYDIPTKLPWITYTEWGKRYGDVVHVEAFGNHILTLNSVKAAMELLEKRAFIYSDRPAIPMLTLMDWGSNFSLMPHTEKWREHRKLFHQHFRREVITAYHPVQLRKVQDLLRSLLSTPEDFVAHSKTLAAGIIMEAIYGYDIKPTHDQFVDMADEAFSNLGASILPGSFIVNTFPFLRHLPSWLPGCDFHRFARDTSKLLDKVKNVPFDFVRQNMRDGAGRSSVLSELLEHNDTNGGSKERESMMKDVTGMVYAAGVDTTVATLSVFFMAMALNPKVVQKAQNEIDSVVGPGCLPGFEHRSTLPYCEAVVRELFRWRPIAPLGLPHATSEDDIYQGYFIPKGTTVFANIWAMVHDEAIYPHPDTFNPERFFTANGQLNDDDRILTFGFGRRACAGRYSADSTIWATVVSVLSAFDIAKARDETGKEVEIDLVFTDRLASHPMPFECAITPRNDATKQLIENLAANM